MCQTSSIRRLTAAFERFEPWYVPAALALALGNYLLRFVRWHIYLVLLEIPLNRRDSFIIFLAGLVMSVTPGKAGELLKAYLVRSRVGTPVSRSAPVVLAERLTDFISLIFLAFLGIFSFRQSALPLVFGLIGISLFVLLLGCPGAIGFLLRTMERLPAVRRLSAPLKRAYEGVRLLVSPGNLLWAVAIGTGAWFAECLGFHLVLLGFGVEVGLVQATFVYSFATLFGALTMLPGGLGPTEGSMSGLLALRGVPFPDAVAATFVIRVCTLWFAVALGAGVLLRYRDRLEGESEDGGEPSEGRGVQGGEAVEQRMRGVGRGGRMTDVEDGGGNER